MTSKSSRLQNTLILLLLGSTCFLISKSKSMNISSLDIILSQLEKSHNEYNKVLIEEDKIAEKVFLQEIRTLRRLLRLKRFNIK